MKGLLGGIMMAIGILVMTTSGLCTLFVVASMLPDMASQPLLLMLPLLVGGIPLAMGIGLLLGGRAIRRDDRQAEAETAELSPRPSATITPASPAAEDETP